MVRNSNPNWDESTYERVKNRAFSENRSMAALIREAVDEFLKVPQKPKQKLTIDDFTFIGSGSAEHPPGRPFFRLSRRSMGRGLARLIFVDTSATLALANPKDDFHDTSIKTLEALLEDDEELFTHNYVILESVALLQRRIGLADAIAFQRDAHRFFEDPLGH